MSKLSTRPRSRSPQGAARPFEGMRQVNRDAAGVDMGAHEIMACVPDGDDQQLVRAFGTDTADLDVLGGLVCRPGHPDGRHGIHGRVLDAAV